MVTEDCFNQELLKIKSEVPFFEFRNTTKPFYIDDYTLRVAASDPITGETLSLNVTLEYFFYRLFFKFDFFVIK